MTGLEIIQGDARELARAFEAPAPTVVITDPIWPNRAPSLFPGIDAAKLLREVLTLLIGKVSHVVLHVGCTTDPRFAAAVPSHWPYWRTCWLPYAVPVRRGNALIGSDVAWVFGPSRYPDGGRVAPGQCRPAIGNRGRGRTAHPCPRSIDHARFLVRWFSRHNETVLDPFAGRGTTLVAAREHGRESIGWELDPGFCAEARRFCAQELLSYGEASKQ